MERFAATLLIEFAEAKDRDAALRRSVDIEKHLWLELGDIRDHLNWTKRQTSTERVSSVQFVRFNVAKDAHIFLKLAQANQVAILADHPNLGSEAFIGGDLSKSLGKDLAD